MSAAAVDAVRCGFRFALLRASSPATPPTLADGQPRRVASIGTSFDAKSATPMKMRTAPSPMKMRISAVPRPPPNRP